MNEITKPQIEFTVKIDVDEVYQAFCEYYWYSKHWLLLTIAFASGTLIVFLPHQSFLFPAVCFGILTIFVPLSRFVIFKYYAQRLLETPMFQSQQHYVLSDDGIGVDSTNFKSSMQWNQFIKWSEATNAFLISPTPYSFYLIPKRCLANVEQVQLKEILKVKIVEKDSPSRRKRIRAAIAAFLFLVLISFVGGFVSAGHRHSHHDSNRQAEDEP
jgi:hypothetical protein